MNMKDVITCPHCNMAVKLPRGNSNTYVDGLINSLLKERDTAGKQGTTIIRMRFALLMLREWNGKSFSAIVAKTVHDWIDGGMNGPVPWPDDPFFAEWATERGWSNVDGSVGFRATVKVHE